MREWAKLIAVVVGVLVGAAILRVFFRAVGGASYRSGDALGWGVLLVAMVAIVVTVVLWPKREEPPVKDMAEAAHRVMGRERRKRLEARALIACAGAAGTIGVMLLLVAEGHWDPKRTFGISLVICAAISGAAGWFHSPPR